MRTGFAIFLILCFSVNAWAQAQTKDTTIRFLSPSDSLKTKEVIEQLQESTEKGKFIERMYQKRNYELSERPPVQFEKQVIREVMARHATVQQLSEIIDKSLEIDTSENNPRKSLSGPSQFDSRIELRVLNPLKEDERRMLTNAESVAIVIEKERLTPITDSIYQFDITRSLGKLYNLCPKEAYVDQPVYGCGTAFIMDSLHMITAGHVFTEPLDHYVIVFGVELISVQGAYPVFVSVKDIFYPKSIVHHSDNDVAIFEIDRPLERPALKWTGSDSLKTGTRVYMIGHPCGLPKKVAVNASMAGEQAPDFFYTTLDAFQGNSGSPVFHFDTHQVIGILVSGEVDFTWRGNCNASTQCQIPYCKGEKVIRIQRVLER